MNLDHVNNAFKKVGIAEIDGVIGADILIRGKAVIDYEKLILYLKNNYPSFLILSLIILLLTVCVLRQNHERLRDK